MVFVPFTGIDNHRKCVTVSSGLLLREDIEAYTWLLTSFMTTHEKQPTMIVTDQDGAMKLAIEEVLTKSKHRLCMWRIMQKIPAKACQILECKTKKGCEIVKVRDKRASAYRILNTRKEKDVVQQNEYVTEYKIRKCLCCGEKTNKHTKSTCPSNPKCVAKLARLVAAAEQGTTTPAATEQATTTATVAQERQLQLLLTKQQQLQLFLKNQLTLLEISYFV
nr:protein FAR1-related sequence 5-like [Tanacetum cinerariifolium]